MASDKWTEKGITFKIPTLEDFESVKAFLYKYFLPDEPVSRSLKLYDGNGFGDRQITKLLETYMIKEGLKQRTSLLALNEDNEIIGCRYSDSILNNPVQYNHTFLDNDIFVNFGTSQLFKSRTLTILKRTLYNWSTVDQVILIGQLISNDI